MESCAFGQNAGTLASKCLIDSGFPNDFNKGVRCNSRSGASDGSPLVYKCNRSPAKCLMTSGIPNEINEALRKLRPMGPSWVAYLIKRYSETIGCSRATIAKVAKRKEHAA